MRRICHLKSRDSGPSMSISGWLIMRHTSAGWPPERSRSASTTPSGPGSPSQPSISLTTSSRVNRRSRSSMTHSVAGLTGTESSSDLHVTTRHVPPLVRSRSVWERSRTDSRSSRTSAPSSTMHRGCPTMESSSPIRDSIHPERADSIGPTAAVGPWRSVPGSSAETSAARMSSSDPPRSPRFTQKQAANPRDRANCAASTLFP